MAFGELVGKFGLRTLEESAAFAIGGATTPALEWIVRPIAHDLNAANPTEILGPEALALVQIRRAGESFDGTGEAAKSGLDAGRYKQLLDSQLTPPGTSEILELFRRREIDIARAKIALQRNGLDEEWLDEYLKLLHFPLSPENVAMARQQGFLERGEAIARSAKQGVDEVDADILFRMAGLPPGAEQMIELWRRGEVTEARVRQSLIEGHIKIDYADDVLKLRYQPLSASIAAEALVRQRIPESKAIEIAAKNGLQRDDFLLWSDMLGRPIATGQALQLARRGEFSYEQFKEAVARSDVRTEYADDLWKLRRTLPNLFQLRALVSSGAITDEVAYGIATDLGYDPVIAHGIVNAAKGAKKQRTKDLAASQVDALFESGLESRKWAIDALIGLGYDKDEAEWHLELLEAKRLLAALQSDLGVIHREYVGHKIDEATASQFLDQIQMSTDARDLLLQTWDNERKANVVRLSNAQIGQALKHAGMARAEAITRWQENGYPEDDATWLADIAEKTPHNAVPPTA